MVTKRNTSRSGLNDHDGFLSEKGTDNSARYRILRLEKDVEDLEQFSDELRLDRTTLEVNLTQLKISVERHNQELIDARNIQVTLATDLTARLDTIRAILNDRITATEKTINQQIGSTQKEFHERMNSLSSDVAQSTQNVKDELNVTLLREIGALGTKFDENKTYVNRWILGALGAVAFLFIVIFITLATHTFGNLPLT
jgi:DNA anti-recombination protein RmuC